MQKKDTLKVEFFTDMKMCRGRGRGLSWAERSWSSSSSDDDLLRERESSILWYIYICELRRRREVVFKFYSCEEQQCGKSALLHIHLLFKCLFELFLSGDGWMDHYSHFNSQLFHVFYFSKNKKGCLLPSYLIIASNPTWFN